MTLYAKTAIKAFEYIKNGYGEESACKKAVSEFTKSLSSQEKGCPKGAFLGLVSNNTKMGKNGNTTKKHNGQMDVVLALWNSGLVK